MTKRIPASVFVAFLTAFFALGLAASALAQCPPSCPISGGGDETTDCFSELASTGMRLNSPFFNPAKPKPAKVEPKPVKVEPKLAKRDPLPAQRQLPAPTPVPTPAVAEPPPPVPSPPVEAPKPTRAEIELKDKLRKEREAEAKRQEEMGGQFETSEEEAPPPHY